MKVVKALLEIVGWTLAGSVFLLMLYAAFTIHQEIQTGRPIWFDATWFLLFSICMGRMISYTVKYEKILERGDD